LVKEVKCPGCQAKIKVLGKKNPIACEECQTKFNVVTLGIPLRIGGIPEQDFERLISEYSRAGQFFMKRFSQRLDRFYIIPKEKGICSQCQKETNLVMESKFDGQKYCSPCAKSYIFGSIAREEVCHEGKRLFEIPLKTFIDMAFTAAQKMFQAWLKNNWGKILKKNEFQRKFQECKERGKELEVIDPVELKRDEVKRIRWLWRQIRKPISPFRFFLEYWLGFYAFDPNRGVSPRAISKAKRKKRRIRLRSISDSLRKEPRPMPPKILRELEAKRKSLRQVEEEIEIAARFLKSMREKEQELREQELREQELRERKVREQEERELKAKKYKGLEAFYEIEGDLPLTIEDVLPALEEPEEISPRTLKKPKEISSRSLVIKLKDELQRLKKTRANLKRKVIILEGKAKTTEIVKRVAKPICQGCENYREYEWGPECQLDTQFRKERPAKIPEFPTTKVQYSKGMYKFIRVEPGLWKISFSLWEKGERKEGLIIGVKWIEEYHKAETVFADTTRYPDLFRHIGKGQKKEYFFIFPLTKVVPLKDQGWLHIIAYCPTTTCVLSIKEDQRKVKFFQHKEIISIKDYYFKQRQEATRGYFKRGRLKESRKIKWVLHNETRKIADHLEKMPGKVILLNIKKRLYRPKGRSREERTKQKTQILD
jgi:hypothetical protein